MLAILDPAHIYPASTHPSLIYDSENVVTLNRYSHTMLDDFKDPITGQPITKEAVYRWWQKIAGEEQWQALLKLKEEKHDRST